MILSKEEIDALYACGPGIMFLQQEPEIAKKINEHMRPFVPKEGDDFHSNVCVLLKPGQGVGNHSHDDHHTVVYYPEECEGPLVEGKRVEVSQGDVIYLPPGVMHEVTPTDKLRISFGMRVKIE